MIFVYTVCCGEFAGASSGSKWVESGVKFSEWCMDECLDSCIIETRQQKNKPPSFMKDAHSVSNLYSCFEKQHESKSSKKMLKHRGGIHVWSVFCPMQRCQRIPRKKMERWCEGKGDVFTLWSLPVSSIVDFLFQTLCFIKRLPLQKWNSVTGFMRNWEYYRSPEQVREEFIFSLIFFTLI